MPNSNAGDDMETDKFKAKNWKKVPDKTFKKMAPQEKSRYMAYEEPPKQVLEAQQNSRKRLVDESKRLMRSNPAASEEELVEKDKHEKLIGQLKAAEARNRLRIMRLRYQSNKVSTSNAHSPDSPRNKWNLGKDSLKRPGCSWDVCRMSCPKTKFIYDSGDSNSICNGQHVNGEWWSLPMSHVFCCTTQMADLVVNVMLLCV